MSTNPETFIADAKRAARRLARTRSDTYQSCLDAVAKAAGRRNWSAFLQAPVDVRSIDAAAGPDMDDPDAPAGFQPGSGEGIVLGADDHRRLVRSARQSTVICIGAAATGKTRAVVLPAVATSPQSSQLIHDLDASIMKQVMDTRCRDHTRMLVLDPLDSVRTRDGRIERMAFNPLHPSCRLAGDTPWEHAMRVATQLIPERGDYFEEKGRLLLAAMMCHLMEAPAEIPPRPDGSARIASIPAVIDWMIALVNEGDLSNSFRRAIEAADAAGASGEILREFSAMVIMGPNERSGILGTADRGLILAKNRSIRQFLDPAEADRGADLFRAFEDGDKPITAFLAGERTSAIAHATLTGLVVEMVGRRRGQLGPSHRSLQILLDETGVLPAVGVVNDALRDGAPAGTSILVVDRNAHASWAGNNRRSAMSWMNEETRAFPSHIVIMGSPDPFVLQRISARVGRSIEPDMLAKDKGRQTVCDDAGIRILTSPSMPERDPA